MLFEQTLDSSDAASEWAGWALAHPEFGVLVFQPGGQFMPTVLLLAHPDLKT